MDYFTSFIYSSRNPVGSPVNLLLLGYLENIYFQKNILKFYSYSLDYP